MRCDERAAKCDSQVCLWKTRRLDLPSTERRQNIGETGLGLGRQQGFHCECVKLDRYGTILRGDTKYVIACANLEFTAEI